MDKAPKLAVVILWLLCVGLVPALQAATIEELTATASDVIHGVCTSVESHWTEDREAIFTYTTVAVSQNLKGDFTDKVVFVQLGGRVGDEVLSTPGQATFEVGEEVVVFLLTMTSKKQLVHDTDRWLIGVSQGKWSVQPDSLTGETRAIMSTQHLRNQESTETSVSLEQLITRVRQVKDVEEDQK